MRASRQMKCLTPATAIRLGEHNHQIRAPRVRTSIICLGIAEISTIYIMILSALFSPILSYLPTTSINSTIRLRRVIWGQFRPAKGKSLHRKWFPQTIRQCPCTLTCSFSTYPTINPTVKLFWRCSKSKPSVVRMEAVVLKSLILHGKLSSLKRQSISISPSWIMKKI